MADKLNNPFKFWEELKRRKVVRVIIGYLASAYVLLELTSIISGPWGLPDWTINFVSVLLIIGFFVTVIISWIFDVTPEGIKKTESAKVIKLKEISSKPAKWRLKISDIVIGVLLIAVCILAYPKFFRNPIVKDIWDKDGNVSVAVMPFLNLSVDSIAEGIELGIQLQLISGLSDSKELEVIPYQIVYEILRGNANVGNASMTPLMSKEIATKLDANLVVNGSILFSGNEIKILAQLIESGRRGISKSFEINGVWEDNLWTVTDTLVNQIKNYLEIKTLEDDLDVDIQHFVTTTNVEALRYFSKSTESSFNRDLSNAVKFLESALELDSNFITAEMTLVPTYINNRNFSKARQLSEKLIMKLDNCTYFEQLYIKYWDCILSKNQQEAVKYSEDIVKEVPNSRIFWYTMGWTYYNLQMDLKAIEAFEKAMEIDMSWETNWNWVYVYTLLGTEYHRTGQHRKEKKIYKLALKVLPNEKDIIRLQAICALSRGVNKEGDILVAKWRKLREENGISELRIMQGLGEIYQDASLIDKAEQYYRQALDLDPKRPIQMNDLAWLLINNDINIKEGLELVNHALEVQPDDYFFQHTKATGLYKQGKYEESLELLEKSWTLRPLYDHDHYLLIQEVKQALAKQKSEK